MHSIWLVPCDKARARFSELISRLSKPGGGPVFSPHVTLLGDLTAPVEILISECLAIFSGVCAARAQIAGVDGGDEFFMSLFLDVALPDTLAKARADLAGSLRPGTSDLFRPHISLAYGPVGGPNKNGLIARIADQLVGYEFDLATIGIVASAKLIPVQQWRLIWRHNLQPLR